MPALKYSAAETAEGETQTLEVDVNAGGWDAEVEHFVDCIRNKKPFLAGAAEGLSALRIALAGYESSKTGKRVVLGR